MSATEIRISRKKVLETEAFKGLSPVLKRITTTRNQLSAIEHGVNVATNIGYDKWERQSNANWRTKQIVLELIEKTD